MEYERIHKVQMGVISPSKLRIKLLGSHGVKRKEGSRNSSSRTSPSKLDDMECSKNSLLAGDPNEEVGSKADQDASSSAAQSSEVPTLELAIKDGFLGCGQDNQTPTFRKDFLPRGARNADHSASSQTAPKCVAAPPQPAGNSFSTVHPLRSIEEDGYGYDSGHDNASSQSFEFYRGDKASQQHQAASPFFRNLPSKWNDAEKWIVHRQMMHTASSALKKAPAQSHGSRHAGFGRADQKHANLQGPEMRRSSSTSSSSNVVEKLTLVPNSSQSSLDTTSAASGVTDLSAVSSDYRSVVPGITKELVHSKLSVPENYTTRAAVVSQSVQSVSMRDIGTEMTPIPSQEPSRTGTPLDATTPSRSPLSSIPSSPKRGTGAPAPSPIKATGESKCQRKVGEAAEVSERELQLKTRREIAALGLQLGKMNIASWASKDDNDHTSPTKTLDVEQAMNSEFEARAAAWEESQKSRYTARYKDEEVQIQAWESQQKVKYEAKMRRFEAQVEQMKARAQEKMMEKLALTRRRVEQKQATADARRKRQAARTSQQVEKIRKTGKIPATRRCCGWFI